MIGIDKLYFLKGGEKRRKIVLTLEALERDILNERDVGEKGYNFKALTRREYISKLATLVASDSEIDKEDALFIRDLLTEENFDERRMCNEARNILLKILGITSAEWSMVIASHPTLGKNSRTFHKDVFVFLEDLRSPFNLGSIFRTGEAMGIEKIFLSPRCVSTENSRARRSAMGCFDFIEHERRTLEELPEGLPVFALETGGTPLCEFTFPPKGVCLIGSEELGLSEKALRSASYGRVSIESVGMKASLNVGVAAGILLHAWSSFLKRSNNA